MDSYRWKGRTDRCGGTQGGKHRAHLRHGAGFMYLANELAVGLEEQQQLEVQLV